MLLCYCSIWARKRQPLDRISFQSVYHFGGEVIRQNGKREKERNEHYISSALMDIGQWSGRTDTKWWALGTCTTHTYGWIHERAAMIVTNPTGHTLHVFMFDFTQKHGIKLITAHRAQCATRTPHTRILQHNSVCTILFSFSLCVYLATRLMKITTSFFFCRTTKASHTIEAIDGLRNAIINYLWRVEDIGWEEKKTKKNSKLVWIEKEKRTTAARTPNVAQRPE